ncbi:MAG TPA: hypothetical protein VK154_11070 [Chitinophagales bacterium]|nr:hypothetical protein [Chitinophagales bacterium]
MQRKIVSLLALVLSVRLLCGQDTLKNNVFVSISPAAISIPLGKYAYELREDIESYANARIGFGVLTSLLHSPVKYFVYGIEVGFTHHKTIVSALDYNVQTFAANIDPPKQLCQCYDTSYYIESKARYNLTAIGKVGARFTKKRWEFLLTAGAGLLIAITPKLQFNEYLNPVPFGNYSVYNRTVNVFPSKAYALFAYQAGVSLGYKITKRLSVYTYFDFTGTHKRTQPYVTDPEYGYTGYIMYANLGAGVRLTLHRDKSNLAMAKFR